MIPRNLLFTILLLVPISAFAHGEAALMSFFYDLMTFIALTVFIAIIRWKSPGKTLLGIILLVSTSGIFIVVNQWPYTANRILIESLMCGVPIVSVLSVYFVFRRKFGLKPKKTPAQIK